MRQRHADRATRAQEEVHPEVHEEDDFDDMGAPENLPYIPPRDGYAQRWIRVSLHGKDESLNIGKALRAGYKPRMWESVPAKFQAPHIEGGQFNGVVGVPDMVLCEIPLALNERHKARIANQTRTMTQAIAKDLAEKSHPYMPISQQRRSQIQKGGRRPNVQGDSPPDPDDS